MHVLVVYTSGAASTRNTLRTKSNRIAEFDNLSVVAVRIFGGDIR